MYILHILHGLTLCVLPIEYTVKQCYHIATTKEHGQNRKGQTKMTKAERTAMKAYKKDLIAQGVDKETAAVMAKTFLEYGIIKPVVNGNA